MDYTDLYNQSEIQLHTLLAEKRVALREMTFQSSNSQLKDVREIRETKRTIARILTALNAKRIAKNV